jgi:glycoprotein 3-alpha-L-fucosyltransferase
MNANIHSDVHINWTATYRQDSIINTPYERFTFFKNYTKPSPPKRNYAQGKTKLIAWFVSNCMAENGRLTYARELQKHVPVDIYGICGTLQCPPLSPQCSHLLSKHYKFYLAFENANCVDYITEKFYWNALRSKHVFDVYQNFVLY